MACSRSKVRSILLWALLCSMHTTATRVGVRVRHTGGSTSDTLKRGLCSKALQFSIEDLAVAEEHQLGWQAYDDWATALGEMDSEQHPLVRVHLDGIPCAKHGCCQSSLLIRPSGSDVAVVGGAVEEYGHFLQQLPWAPRTILDGGGNIGAGTLLFTHMYPDAEIVVLEPQPDNCQLLKANTQAFAQVRVLCLGLWSEATSLGLATFRDGRDWAWQLQEVPEGTVGAVKTTTVPALLAEFGFKGFDYAKLDIEGAEFAVFNSSGADLSWLNATRIISLEVHADMALSGTSIDELHTALSNASFFRSTFGEYDVFAKSELHPYVRVRS